MSTAIDSYTVALAAQEIGCSSSTASRWANRLGLGKRLGPVLLLSGQEVEQIRRAWKRKPGNPNFGKQPETKK